MQLIYNNLGIFVLLVSSFIDVSISETRVVCYYTNWSVYRPGTAKFNPQNINPYLCTHLIYAFGGFTKDNQLKTFDKYQDIEQGGYAKFTGLKTYNKDLKTMLAIGGWNEGSTRFSPLVASSERRSQLVKNAIKFLRQNKFDGLDLDWEYPAFRDGGKAKDRENYAKLVQELREEFDREHQKTGRPRLLLTMAVPAGFEYIDKGYDVPKLNKFLDWFNLLSYDYHSAFEPSVNHHAPLYPIEEENEYSFDNDLNINATIDYYLKHGAERDKLVLGIPTYGRSYTLFNPESYEIGAPADGPGEQGDATREKGYLAYYEICQSLKEEESGWTVVQPNPDALGPYAYKENQWVGYDDEEIVRRKSEFVVEQKLGGIMFWSIDNDDFRGLCDGKPYPLIEAAKEAYLNGLEFGVQTKSNKPKQHTIKTTTKKQDARKNGKTTTPAPPTTPSTGSDFKCDDEGFFSHPSDCTKYFWCLEAPGLGLVAHHFSCPSGLVFNKIADSCDYARNVHCSNKAPKRTSTTEALPTKFTTTTTTERTERTTYNKLSSIYKSPIRTTTPRTTTTSIPIEIDSSDLEQEDPKVIKELIELIKKAGGIEELEKQINIQEETLNEKSDSKITAQTTKINKSLVDKIKNRATLFKTRPPLFNGASQAERTNTQKVSAEKTLIENSDEKNENIPKKYNSINRFSRPESQNTGIDKPSESDTIVFDKPKYTSISRRKPTKPDVITENDYNNDSDRNSEEKSPTYVSDYEGTKKYASISRPTRIQEKFLEEEKDDDKENDEEDEYEDYLTTTTFAPTAKSTINKYINLSRKRSTTTPSSVDNKIDTQLEITTQEPRTTLSSRRRTTTTEDKTTIKTVLEINPNHENHNFSKNTFTLPKNTAKDTEKNSLISNKHKHYDDNINHIALPTESVTEIISLPESVTFTQILNTIFPHLIDNEYKDVFLDSATENSDIDVTTITGKLIVENDDLSETKPSTISEQKKKNSPRPFSLSKTTQRTSSSLPPFTSPTSQKRTKINNESTQNARRRPTKSQTTITEAPESDEDFKISSSTHTYRHGYRGSARFKASTKRSGEYNSKDFQFLENNRLRSLNIERGIESTQTSTTIKPIEKKTQRQRQRTQQTFTTNPKLKVDETTTESKILEKSRFNISPDERPERLRFELVAGRKIDFGFNSVKSKEKVSTQTADGDSKVKVITGPLDKSPVNISGREFKQGHVEEIPIQTSPESVTVINFSNKLDLTEIPLNQSDIETFVPNSKLRTNAPFNEETSTISTKKRFRPSTRRNEQQNINDEVYSKIPSTRSRILQKSENARRSQIRLNQNSFLEKINSGNQLSNESKAQLATDDKSSTENYSNTAKYLTKVKASALQFKNKSTYNKNAEDSENSETQDILEESNLKPDIKLSEKEKYLEYEENTTIDSDVLDMITEKTINDDEENEIDFANLETTQNPLSETTFNSLPKKIIARKRPKKIESLANRQTITEPANNLGIESTSNLSFTDDEDYETKIETASDEQNIDTTSVKPTRKFVVTRKRINNSIINNNNLVKEDKINDENTITTQKTFNTTPKTTRKRILTIRTKTGVIHSTVDVGKNETIDISTESLIENKLKAEDRKIIKVYRSRSTTERIVDEESSTNKPNKQRTRVFKRPINRQSEDTTQEPELLVSEKKLFTQRRKIIKVTRKPLIPTSSEGELNQDDPLNESSSVRPTNRFTKVIRTKIPKVITETPPVEDPLVIETDNQNHKIETFDGKNEDDIENENKEVSIEEPSFLTIQHPTRTGGKVSVTIRKRPPFNQGTKLTTIHPASTRFTKEEGSNLLQNRIRKVTTKRFRPSFSSTENDQEKKTAFGEKNKKIYVNPYRKTVATSTISPNITPHNIDIETETNEEIDDTTDNSEITNNNGILQTVRPRFPLSRFTTSTTSKPTTLHHVFAIDIEQDDMNKLKNAPENQADEVIKKLQKLIEINRIVEVYSKEEKLKLLKNKKLKSIKAGELTLEKPPVLNKFGEITREVIIKLSVKPNVTTTVNSTTEQPNETRSPKSIMFSETIFGTAETSTISLEGLFDREKKGLEPGKEKGSDEEKKDIEISSLQSDLNTANHFVAAISNSEQIIRNKKQEKLDEYAEIRTESPENDTTTILNDE